MHNYAIEGDITWAISTLTSSENEEQAEEVFKVWKNTAPACAPIWKDKIIGEILKSTSYAVQDLRCCTRVAAGGSMVSE